MRARRELLSVAVMIVLYMSLAMCRIGTANTIIIDFTTFPDGTPIPNETPVSNQFEPLGVVFPPLFPNSPRVLTALGGILISGGPTGFFDDISMKFFVPVTSITIEIIGSGLNISASLEAFNPDGT